MAWTPPGSIGPVPINVGGTAVTSVTTSPTATSWAGWDNNANFSANNLISGIDIIVTSGGTTTLTVGSNENQVFTGTDPETCVMPVVSTLVLSQSYRLINKSSDSITVNSSGGDLIQSMSPSTVLVLICTSITGTDASSWTALYSPSVPFSFPLMPSVGGTGLSNDDANTLTIGAASVIDQDVSQTGTPSFQNVSAKDYMVYAFTVNTGNISFQCADNAGNFNNILTNASTSAARTWTLPNASGVIALTSGASGIVNSGTSGQLTYYASTGTTVSGTNAGTGVITALGVNIGTAGSFVVNGGALGTPSSGTLTSCTGLPISGITGLGTGVATALAATVTGSGGIALSTSPVFTTPNIGAATGTSLTVSGAITSTSNNIIVQAGNSFFAQSPTLNMGGIAVTGRDSAGNFAGNIINASLSAARTWIFPDASGNVVLQGSALGTPSSGTLTNCTGLPISGTTGYGTGVATALSVNTNSTGGLAVETDGTFTPTITFGGAAVGVTYTTQQGIYSRIGNVINFTITLTLSNKGSSTGNVSINGLPIAGRSGSGGQVTPCTVQNVIFTNNPFGVIVSGSTSALLVQNVTASGTAILQDTACTNTSSFSLTGTYLI